ncbi:hypothetical protein [Roseibium marinum]|uniref:Uncharacterized protein n=1 Tax=Roseibium marinum TaxID=281252 RepID=A0A2S3USC6_9HYPH|nr:hypothetical protein [Roseibium marinum]POF30622.1 hypothetical protein CLV41_106236 [Roseibium marinum]
MYFAMVLYLFAAAIVGLIGRNTAAGFIGMFLLSIIVSPLLALIFLFLLRPNKRERLRLEQARLDEEMRQTHRQTL